MERAFIQYLRSLAQSGLLELPQGNAQVRASLQAAIDATLLQSQATESQVTESPVDDLQAMESQSGGTNSGSMDSQSSPGQSSSKQSESATQQRPTPTAKISTGTFSPTEKPDQLRILADQVKNCFQCNELVANRTRTVFGVGNPDAKLCFVGEAPGAEEDVQGEPFVGAAGKLLDRIMTACHLSREQVYILNTIKCRPPNNRNPTEQECANCRPFLDEQLSILQPDFVCCLGGIAAQRLLDTSLSVGRLRGKVHLYHDIRVVVTYHPAYLLRNPDAKRQVWTDMKFLMREMGQPID